MCAYMHMRMAGAAYARTYIHALNYAALRCQSSNSGGSPPLDANTIANVVAGVVSSLQSTPSSSSLAGRVSIK